MCFIAENPLSHSAVEAGIVNTRPFDSLKNLLAKVASDFQNLLARSKIYWPNLICLAFNNKKRNYIAHAPCLTLRVNISARLTIPTTIRISHTATTTTNILTLTFSQFPEALVQQYHLLTHCQSECFDLFCLRGVLLILQVGLL